MTIKDNVKNELTSRILNCYAKQTLFKNVANKFDLAILIVIKATIFLAALLILTQSFMFSSVSLIIAICVLLAIYEGISLAISYSYKKKALKLLSFYNLLNSNQLKTKKRQ